MLTRLLIAGWGSSSEAGHLTQVTGPREADVRRKAPGPSETSVVLLMDLLFLEHLSLCHLTLRTLIS